MTTPTLQSLPRQVAIHCATFLCMVDLAALLKTSRGFGGVVVALLQQTRILDVSRGMERDPSVTPLLNGVLSHCRQLRSIVVTRSLAINHKWWLKMVISSNLNTLEGITCHPQYYLPFAIQTVTAQCPNLKHWSVGCFTTMSGYSEPDHLPDLALAIERVIRSSRLESLQIDSRGFGATEKTYRLVAALLQRADTSQLRELRLAYPEQLQLDAVVAQRMSRLETLVLESDVDVVKSSRLLDELALIPLQTLVVRGGVDVSTWPMAIASLTDLSLELFHPWRSRSGLVLHRLRRLHLVLRIENAADRVPFHGGFFRSLADMPDLCELHLQEQCVQHGCLIEDDVYDGLIGFPCSSGRTWLPRRLHTLRLQSAPVSGPFATKLVAALPLLQHLELCIDKSLRPADIRRMMTNKIHLRTLDLTVRNECAPFPMTATEDDRSARVADALGDTKAQDKKNDASDASALLCVNEESVQLPSLVHARVVIDKQLCTDEMMSSLAIMRSRSKNALRIIQRKESDTI